MDFLYTQKSVELNENNVSRGARTGFGENLQAAYDEQVAVGNAFSEENNFDLAYAERYEILKNAGIDYAQLSQDSGMMADRGHARHGDREKYFDKYIRPLLPAEISEKILTGNALNLRAREIALEAVHKNADIANRAAGTGATVGQFGGAMGGAMTDSVNILSMVLNPVGGVAKRIVTEIAIGSLSEGLIQVGVQDYRAELGLEHGFAQGFEAALMAGAGAGLLRGGIEIGGLAYKRAVLAAHKKNIKNPSAEEINARNVIERDVAHEELNPHGDTPAGRTQHDVMQAEADARLVDDELVIEQYELFDEAAASSLEINADEQNALPVASAVTTHDVAEIAGAETGFKDLPIFETARFVADDVKTDVKRFPDVGKKATRPTSSKVAVSDSAIVENGDASGVVWQAVDGERIVVSGHDEFAKIGKNNDLDFDAHLLREVDGWSVKKVKQALRAKNSRQFEMPKDVGSARTAVPRAGADNAASLPFLREGAATAQQNIDDMAAYGESAGGIMQTQSAMLERNLRQKLAAGDDFELGAPVKDGAPTQTAKDLLDEIEQDNELIAVLDACDVRGVA